MLRPSVVVGAADSVLMGSLQKILAEPVGGNACAESTPQRGNDEDWTLVLRAASRRGDRFVPAAEAAGLLRPEQSQQSGGSS